MGIIQLHRIYGSERLNSACKRALYIGTLSLKHISNILKNKLDQELLEDDLLKNLAPHIPMHENLRGQQAYQ